MDNADKRCWRGQTDRHGRGRKVEMIGRDDVDIYDRILIDNRYIDEEKIDNR